MIKRPLRREFEHASDRHLISSDCAQTADNLYTFVRSKKVNYAKHDLLALCILQVIFQFCNQHISVNQLCAILHCSLNEVFFRRKHKKLCIMFPFQFSEIPFSTPSYGLSILGLPPKKEHSIRKKCRELMARSKFEFSQGTILQCIMIENKLTSDIDLIKFISSYPHKYEIKKCTKIVFQNDFNPLL